MWDQTQDCRIPNQEPSQPQPILVSIISHQNLYPTLPDHTLPRIEDDLH